MPPNESHFESFGPVHVLHVVAQSPLVFVPPLLDELEELEELEDPPLPHGAHPEPAAHGSPLQQLPAGQLMHCFDGKQTAQPVAEAAAVQPAGSHDTMLAHV